MKFLSKRLILAGATGIVLGALLVFGLRLIFAQNPHVHYHANFELYVNGTRDQFKSFTFYEEVQACSLGGTSNDPKTRAHMHEPNNHVVHVHDHGVTWSDFFANLGYTLGDNLIKTDAGVFVDGADGKQLSFILNGQPTHVIANRIIGDKDVLLVNYGTENSQELMQHYNQIPHDAAEFDTHADPMTCAGQTAFIFTDRLKQALDLRK